MGLMLLILTDSASHAVKENPAVLLSWETHVMTSFNADNRQQVKMSIFSYFTKLWTPLRFVMTPCRIGVNYQHAGITKWDRHLVMSVLADTVRTFFLCRLATDIAWHYSNITIMNVIAIIRNLQGFFKSIQLVTLIDVIGMIFWNVWNFFPKRGTWISSFEGTCNCTNDTKLAKRPKMNDVTP